MASAYLETVRRPQILELPGCVEIFADIGVCMDYGETVRILLGAATGPGSPEFELVGKLYLPKSGFRRSLMLAVADFCPMVGLN